MEREISRFRAASGDGEVYIVIEYQEFIEHRPLGSSYPQLLKGPKRLILADGRSVNFIDDENLEIVQTGQIIQKIH